MVEPAPRRRLRTLAADLCLVIAAIAIAWTIVVLLTGGVTLRLGAQRVSSTDPWRPAIAALLCLGAAIVAAGPGRARAWAWRVAGAMTPARVVIAGAILTTTIGLAYGTWTASGPDSFAYVSQATLWRTGLPRLAIPMAVDAPWPSPARTFMPFGYRPAPTGEPALVPVTSPGLPIVMALAQTAGGHAAAFAIVPAAAGLCIWLTYALGTRLRSPRTGLVAALLIATNPVALFMLMWPMTDVPAAMIVTLAVWLLTGERRPLLGALSAGLAIAFGILLRPNMLLIAAAMGVWVGLDRGRARRPGSLVRSPGFGSGPEFEVRTLDPGPNRTLDPGPGTPDRTEPGTLDQGPRTTGGSIRPTLVRALAFAAGVLPGVAAMLWLNATWYGSPFASGYGSAESLFSVARVGMNVARYGGWLAASSPLLLVGLAALAWPRARWWARAGGPRIAILLGLVAAADVGLYLIYEPYDAWWYLRFLLPVFPILAVAAAVALDGVLARGRAAATIVTTILIAAAAGGLFFARTHGVFTIHYQERRFATVASLVARVTEPDAAILTVQHSGSTWYYSGRQTLRWDELDPAWLDRAISWLAATGRHPYLLIEDTEQAAFERRFAASGPAGPRLPPYAVVMAWQSRHVPGWVRLYDPLKRDAATATVGPEYEDAMPWCSPPARGW